MNPDDPLGLKTPPQSPSDPLGLIGKTPIETQTDDTPHIQKSLEAVVSHIPGGQRAWAGYAGLGSLLSGEGLDAAADKVNNSVAEQNADVNSLNKWERRGEQFGGDLVTGAALAPLGPWKGAIAAGGLVGADRPAASLSDRAKNTAIGGAFGLAGAGAGKLLGAGARNVGARTGITDAIERQIAKVSPKFAATMGTRGQVNEALSGRQAILDNVGSSDTDAAAQQIARIAEIRKKAAQMYGIAKADKRAIQDPELQAMLNDPQVKPVFQAASEIRDYSGNPLPQTNAPAQVPLALQKMGVSPERYAELQQVGQSRRVPMSGTDILPPELMGPQSNGVELPDPDVLAKTKRYLMDAANGLNQTPLNINKDRARALLPKMDAIRNKLHDVSPAWREADAYYADAKGQEEAFSAGYDAVKHINNVNGSNLTENSPEAMLKAISEPRYPNEPAQAIARRAEAFREGMKGFLADQVKGQTVDKGLDSVLGSSSLEPTQSGAQARALMMGSAPEANSLEQTIAEMRGKMLGSSGGGSSSRVPVSARGLKYLLARKIFAAPDMLNTPEGQTQLMQRIGNQPFQNTEISNFRQGSPYMEQLLRSFGIGAGSDLSHVNSTIYR